MNRFYVELNIFVNASPHYSFAESSVAFVLGSGHFDTQEFVEECRRMNVTPHVAQNKGRRGGSAIDARTTRHTGYPESQKRRKRIEECFG